MVSSAQCHKTLMKERPRRFQRSTLHGWLEESDATPAVEGYVARASSLIHFNTDPHRTTGLWHSTLVEHRSISQVVER